MEGIPRQHACVHVATIVTLEGETGRLKRAMLEEVCSMSNVVLRPALRR